MKRRYEVSLRHKELKIKQDAGPPRHAFIATAAAKPTTRNFARYYKCITELRRTATYWRVPDDCETQLQQRNSVVACAHYAVVRFTAYCWPSSPLKILGNLEFFCEEKSQLTNSSYAASLLLSFIARCRRSRAREELTLLSVYVPASNKKDVLLYALNVTPDFGVKGNQYSKLTPANSRNIWHSCFWLVLKIVGLRLPIQYWPNFS